VIEKTGGSERIRKGLCHSTLLFVSCLLLLLATWLPPRGAHGFASHPCERFAFFNKRTFFFEVQLWSVTENTLKVNTDHAHRTNRSKTNHATCCHTKVAEKTEGCYEHANGFPARLRNGDRFPEPILAVYNQLNYKVQIRGGNNGDKHGVSGDPRDVI